MNPHADPRELCCTKKAANHRIRRAGCGRREDENDQQRTRRKTPGVLEHKSGQQAAAREVPGVIECSGKYKDLKCVSVGVHVVGRSMKLTRAVSK
jgi:hypothetical protein